MVTVCVGIREDVDLAEAKLGDEDASQNNKGVGNDSFYWTGGVFFINTCERISSVPVCCMHAHVCGAWRWIVTRVNFTRVR